MDANRKAAILTWLTAAGTLLAAVAMHGDKALSAMGGVPTMLRAWSDQMPLGAWSFTVALVLGTLLWLVAIVKLPQTKRLPHFSADTITLFVAVLITVTQQWLAETRTAGAILNALCLGMIAGLGAPYIGRGLRALFQKPTP